MSCTGPTMPTVGLSLKYLGVTGLRWTATGGEGGAHYVSMTTDDGHEIERSDTNGLAALEAATNAVVMLRMEQRKAARTACPYGRPHDAGPCSACTDS